MSGSVALVTGGSRGIGARVCRRLAHEGFDVAVGYAQSRDAAEQVAERVEGAGAHAVTLAGDVGDAMVRKRLVQRTVDELDGLDVLVNAAGVREPEPFLEVPPGELDKALRVDVAASFHLCQLAGERMREAGGGSIVNVAAAAGLAADPEQAVFSVSKAAVVSLTRTAAVALAPDVNVNAVAPGFVPTDTGTEIGPGARQAVEQQTPAGRWTSKAEVADAVTYLAQAPNTITGETVRLDGGLSSQLYAVTDDEDDDGGEDLDLPGIRQRIEGPPEEVLDEDPSGGL